MKKIVYLLFIVLIICGCSNTNGKIQTKNIEENVEIPEEEKEEYEEYIDNNKAKIGIYLYENGKYNLVTKYETNMVDSKDIVIFDIYPSNDQYIERNNYIYNLYEEYTSLDNYDLLKIGFNLKYTLIDGREISYNILDPDSALNYEIGHIYAWLYDDYKHRNDSFYSHIEQYEFDTSLVTSIKLYSNNKEEIASPIHFTVFTYDSLDDFDLNGNYRGNSSYSIDICDINKTC